jgi:hypothetical protein
MTTQSTSGTQNTPFPPITVRVLGRAAELFAGQATVGQAAPFETKVQVSARTPRTIIQEIAKKNPLIADQLIRSDGTPRSSTKILIKGKPPESLDARLVTREEAAAVTPAGGAVTPEDQPIIIIIIDGDGDILIVVIVPCDG